MRFLPTVTLLLSLGAPAQAAAPSKITTASIQSITASAPQNGQVEVKVTYWVQACRQHLAGIFPEQIPPFSLSQPRYAVSVLLEDFDLACAGPTGQVTATFSLPAIAGSYELLPVQ